MLSHTGGIDVMRRCANIMIFLLKIRPYAIETRNYTANSV